jgi:hypothetical protein
MPAIRVRTSSGWQDIALAGPAGPGVPSGGAAGQVLTKVDATDYNTAWRLMPQLIQTIGPLGAAQANFDFTSIPQTFSHLQIVGHVTCVTSLNEVAVRLNNDSGNNYEYGGMFVASGAAPANFYSAGATNRWRVAEAGGAGGEFIAFTCVIPAYTLGYRKHYHSSYGGYDSNGNIAGTAGGRWFATVAAITRLVFLGTAGSNFDVGSIMSLYGLP